MCDRCRELRSGTRHQIGGAEIAQRVLYAKEPYKSSQEFVTDAMALARLVMGDERLAALELTR